MFLNDLEIYLFNFIDKGFEGIDVYILKMFLLLSADDIVIFANSCIELPKSLMHYMNSVASGNLLLIQKKTKVKVFRTGGRLQRNISFRYNGNHVNIVPKFIYNQWFFL
jgi:hypothetical protein